MVKLLRKGGASHIEIIFAFVLFMAVVGVALFFFRPGAGGKLIEVSLDYVSDEVLDNVSVGVETYSVKVNEVATGNLALLIQGVDGGMWPRVVDGEGVELSSYRMGDSIIVEDQGSWANIDFIYVTFSEEFANGGQLTGTEDPTFYTLGSSDFREVISEKRTIELISSYNVDYFGLKESFNLPDRVNFGFSVGALNARREIPVNFEVFSNSERKEVLKETGEIVFEDFTAEVW